MSCGTITRGSQPDCDNLPLAGTRARLILINWTDVVEIEEDENGIITSITLAEGCFAYEFLGFRKDVSKSESVIKTSKKNRFRHSVGFVVYEVDQIQKNNVKRISKGRFIAIVEGNGKDENSIEVLGKNVGLEIVGGVIRDAYTTSGVFTIDLQTPGNPEFEKKLPQNLGYSYGEALIIIENLLEQPPWILAEGVWDDDGSWFDSETWID